MKEKFQTVLTNNSVLVLSFLCPYMFGITLSETHSGGGLMAPIWILGIQDGILTLGPILLVLITGFTYWIPYVYVGHEFKKLATDEENSWSRFRFRVLVATFIAVLQVVWISYINMTHGSRPRLYIPLPIVSVIALILGRRFVPREVEEPW
ncbi:MAG: hypothetical protein KGY80_14475 [Candidatus Thorarchaeota archaeon]|nr:hypothetical protein [Candidatus Thorarchaeota archaeon]